MTRFVDTTILVERITNEHDAAMQAAIDSAVGDGASIACSYSRLEFKQLVIQNIALALNTLVTEESFFGALKRCGRYQRDRQTKFLLSIYAWCGHAMPLQSEVRAGDDFDQLLLTKSVSFLRNALMHAWYRFDAVADGIVDGTGCQRAREAPRKTRTGSFDASIPEGKCRSRQCRNVLFIQERLRLVKELCGQLDALDAEGGLTDELRDSFAILKAALRKGNLQSLYEYQKCRDVGDVWIHLESVANRIADFVTTNYKESNVLCPLLGLNPVIVTRPPPKKLKKYRHDSSSGASGPVASAESHQPKKQ